MKKHWTGVNILEGGVVFLLNESDNNKGYKIIGKIEDDEGMESIEKQLKPFVLKYEDLLKDENERYMIWVADHLDIEIDRMNFKIHSDRYYEASWRVSYAPWVVNPEKYDMEYEATEEEKKHPFYYDIAESDERVGFSHVVNGTDIGYGYGKNFKVDKYGATPRELEIEVR